MGTYGTTFIVKGDKHIDLTDSHDGYFSAMGLSNLLSIKYMSDETINRLFDAYNAQIDEDNYDEVELSERQLKDVIFQVARDSKNSSEAIEWIEQILSDDIRASTVGFGPLLYLNINPGFTTSDVSNYIIDLDKKEFIYTSWSHEAIFKLSFDTIRNASKNTILYFANNMGDDFKLLEKSNYAEYDKEIYEMNQNEKDPVRLKELTSLIQEEVNQVFALPEEIINAHTAKVEAQRLANLAQYQARLEEDDEDDMENSVGGFSIRSAQSIALPQLRKLIVYVQKYMSIHPEAKFLEETVEWGLSEDGKTGGFRIFSPKEPRFNKLYEEVISTLEYRFKIGMNGFSSSGTYGADGLQKEDSIWGEVSGPQQSIFNLETVKSEMPDWIPILKDADPTIGYHIYYNEGRQIPLENPLANPMYSLQWLFFALLNQDSELIEKVYDDAATVFNKQDSEIKKMIASSILKSIEDSKHINELLKLENSPIFIETLKEVGLLELLNDYMSEREKFELV